MNHHREVIKPKPFLWRWSRRSVHGLFLLPFICFMSFFLIELIVGYPRAAQEQKKLESELNLLSPPEEASLVERSDGSHQTSQASAFRKYDISWTADQVFQYYDTILKQNGWNFNQRRDFTLASIGRQYCKGDYTAHLDYSVAHIGYAWKYAIRLSWGLAGDCPGDQSFVWKNHGWFIMGFPLTLLISLVIAIAYRVQEFRRI